MLVELGLQSKVITITGDNARNNEVMASELYNSLKAENPEKKPLFQGEESFVRCLAHIWNLIVKDILRTLKSGNIDEAFPACNDLRDGIFFRFASTGPLAKLRIFALWIDRSPSEDRNGRKSATFSTYPISVSAKKPQISLSSAIYYELHDLLYDASERK
jgi:hypothetical protein